jgi:hypothetical protein
MLIEADPVASSFGLFTQSTPCEPHHHSVSHRREDLLQASLRDLYHCDERGRGGTGRFPEPAEGGGVRPT